MVIKGFTTGVYYFRMVSYNETGTTWSNELIIDVQIPSGDDDTPRISGYNTFFLLSILSVVVFTICKKLKKP